MEGATPQADTAAHAREQEYALKRAAFQRKQRALRDAMVIGDRLARRQRRLLAAATLGAWRGRVRTLAVASGLAARILRRCVHGLLLHWRAHLQHKVGQAAATCTGLSSVVADTGLSGLKSSQNALHALAVKYSSSALAHEAAAMMLLT